MNWFSDTRDWITSHLGKNPKNGGNPPNDSKFMNRVNFKILDLKNKVNNWLIWINWNELNKKIILKDKRV